MIHGHGATFTFALFTDNSHLSWHNIDLQISGVRAVVYPPFRSAPLNRNLAPDFHFNSSPAFSRRRITVTRTIPNMCVYPTLEFNAEGMTGMISVWGDDRSSSDMTAFSCDSVQMDAFTTNEQTAETVFRKLHFALRNLRRYSGQWWVNRVNLSSAAGKNVLFHVDENYNLLKEPWSGASMNTERAYVKKITEPMWRSAWFTSLDDEPSTSWDVYLDSIFYQRSGDLFNAVATLSNSMEMLKIEIYQELFANGVIDRRTYRQAVGDYKNMPWYFGEKMFSLVGSSIEDENPNHFFAIEQIWKCRNVVSHGRQIEVDRHLGTENFDDDFVGKLADAVLFAFRFCSRLVPRSKRLSFTVNGHK